MLLRALPLVFILAGVVFYAVLGGADFGAGAGRLFAGRGARGAQIRDHAQHSMGPVWEANHVWLIFVLTVAWTAYPRFLTSLASTLTVPLLVAGLGIIARGTSYALRSAAAESEVRRVDTVFGIVSLLTPFMLGTCIGALAADRVPVGNAAGGLWSSWTGPVSLLVGALSVIFCLYLAAVFLAADAARHHDPALADAMRLRALAAGLGAGALSLAGLAVIHQDAHPLYRGLTHGGGLVAIVVSLSFGAVTVGLVVARRYEAARFAAPVAVAAVVAGWAIARWPHLLPGLTLNQAAASHDTLICVVVAVIAGGALLFPALGLLFSLAVSGRLDGAEAAPLDGPRRALPQLIAPGLGLRLCVALLVAGVGLLNGADAGWCHILGVLSLTGFLLVGFGASIRASLGSVGQEGL